MPKDMTIDEQIEAEVQKRLGQVREEIRQECMVEVKREFEESGRAALVVVESMFKTEEINLPEMTDMPIGAIFPMSILMTKEMMYHPKVLSGEVLLSHVWWVIWCKLRRSVDSQHLIFAKDLATQQIQAQAPGGGLGGMFGGREVP